MKRINPLGTLLLTTLITLSACTNLDDFRNRLDALEGKMKNVENLVASANKEIAALRELVEAQNKKLTILSYETLDEGKGYLLKMSDGSEIKLFNGINGLTSKIGVKTDTDGILYWLIDGEWIYNANGQKIRAGEQGATPKETPLLRIDSNGCWEISLDNGKRWEQVFDTEGKPMVAIGSKSAAKNLTIEAKGEYVIIHFNGQSFVFKIAGQLPKRPTNVSECNAQDVETIRAIATANGFGEEFVGEDPSKWNYDRLPISWRNIASGKEPKSYVVVALGDYLFKQTSIKRLELTEGTKGLKHLESIDIEAPELEFARIQDQLKLQSIKINGQERGNRDQQAKVKQIIFGSLPSLTSIALENLPELVTNKEEIENEPNFQIHYAYGYDNLAKISIINCAALKNIEIDPMGSIQELQIAGLPSLQGLIVTAAALEQLQFTPENFSELRRLKLNKLLDGKEVTVKNLKKLEYLQISRCNSIESVTVTGCPEITHLTLSQCSIQSRKLLLKDLPKAKTIDLQGNRLTEIYLADFSACKNIMLADNDFTSSSLFRLPTSVSSLTLNGNEMLKRVDLTACTLLESLNINGYAKGQSSIDTKKPLPLSELELQGLEKLERLRCENNYLTTLFDGTFRLPKLEEPAISWNEFDIKALVNIIKTIDLDNGKPELKGQRAFKVKVPKDGRFDFSSEARYLRETLREELDLSLLEASSKKPASNTSYDYNKETGILQLKQPGSYIIKISSNTLGALFDRIYEDLYSESFNYKP